MSIHEKPARENHMIDGEAQNREISKDEIIETLAPLNGRFFFISDMEQYTDKIVAFGKCRCIRDDNNKLLSYTLYYDNRDDVFISMVWSDPGHAAKGLSRSLLSELIHSTTKEICLKVRNDNVAKYLYENMGFRIEGILNNESFMRYKRKVAIMQPYAFPYLGYFHLIHSSDTFVFYDDVNYITRGWINRNRILLNGNPHEFTIPISAASQNKLINETQILSDEKWRRKFLATLANNYGKAPYYTAVSQLIASIIAREYASVADLAIGSTSEIFEYLGLCANFVRSSEAAAATKGLGKADRLIAITKHLGYSSYVNAAGGTDLYSKKEFAESGIELSFIQSKEIKYQQFSNEFVPWLSIIDVLMFNDILTTRQLLSQYRLK